MCIFRSNRAISLILAALFVLPVHAAKPVHESGLPFGNGFPSGPKFNLNMLGKKYGFECPPPDYDESGAQTYGNVIFTPRWSAEVTVYVESGRKGPKSAPDATQLEVTDWCTESFPDYDETTGDYAAFRLPYNDAGYAVYARITGKPGPGVGEPTATFQPPELYYVEDEAGNDLVLLGLVRKDGVSTVTADGTVVHRTSTDSSKKGKGVQKATNISDLFEWSGEICYLQADTDDYCLDESGMSLCDPKPVCCVDEDGDGTCERYVISVDGATCPDPTVTPLIVACRTYWEEWIFNIGDFVGTMWPIYSTGAYNVQVRFYPL